ncbi:SpoU rRNA Methylase family protein [Pustulibacterium marinum]|uniref:SpoU rRNA Methylase family protein n=1 Tax=Pustulibacterium marinum TaxID=1224947 RepID=A0A1I7HXC4_9FLAO|nr:TrmH family RNA methyltransferase [Pustulibacterium marinum]SFU65330.1 SpoU rRNA Methylase family protein [Pustulibacterium marinum]
MQLTHDQNKFQQKTFPITIVCDAITSPANVGGIFRAADAFGAEKVIFCGSLLPDFGKRMQKTSRSTEKYVPFEFSETILTTLESLKEDGYKLLALEITENSTPLQQLQLSKTDKIAIIIGAERLGVSEEVLNLADVISHIEMFGNNSSMNVAQALTVALYQVTKCIS